MHEGLRIFNQALVVVSSSSYHYALRDALHFVRILWRIHFFATRGTLYTGFKGWFYKVAAPGTLHMFLKLAMARRDV